MALFFLEGSVVALLIGILFQVAWCKMTAEESMLNEVHENVGKNLSAAEFGGNQRYVFQPSPSPFALTNQGRVRITTRPVIK